MSLQIDNNLVQWSSQNTAWGSAACIVIYTLIYYFYKKKVINFVWRMFFF